MPAIVCLLRGVNMGAHNRMKMEPLRALFDSLRLRNPRTYIQSGNVVFTTSEKDLDKLAARIRLAVGRDFGFHPDVLLRTAAELGGVAARNPFSGRTDVSGDRLVVFFLPAEPGPEARQRVLALNSGPEEIHFDGRELYIHFPNGVSQSKLSLPAVERALKSTWTGRNWNTVLKLLEMTQATA
ncbi:MAG: DUF1697 domain-containing protein [Candidatus Solibacter usitatus]|nr:DUF1697 domain-containing protein [Candidatus Solibacter usitatus]